MTIKIRDYYTAWEWLNKSSYKNHVHTDELILMLEKYGKTQTKAYIICRWFYNHNLTTKRLNGLTFKNYWNKCFPSKKIT